MIPIERILEKVRARPSGRGYVGHCPAALHAHADRSPSLSISEGDDGRILFHCFAGCSIENICQALEIRVADLFAVPGSFTPKTRIVREAEKAIRDLRSRLTPRERVLEVVVIVAVEKHLDASIARALDLAVNEQELVQLVMERAK